MTYETSNITFHMIRVKLSSGSRCSRTLPMNVAIESARCGCDRTSCSRIGLGRRCVEKHGRRYDQSQSIV